DGCPSGDGGQETCIDNISDMFYQSLLCPDNSTYDTSRGEKETWGNDTSWVNTHCKCNTGYKAWGSSCLIDCPDNSIRNNYGTCVCNSGYKMVNGECR
ncbi:MAG: hypothetical protein IJ273_02120, partial [Alphaproteobacteria bacterium]|nr:hypothetical protein [Alphaproteobacteria bacterium]